MSNIFNTGEATPLLIAKQKDAKILKDDYKLGWLIRDNSGYLWTVWGSSSNYENAMKVAQETLLAKGTRRVYFSEEPLKRDKAVYNHILSLTEIKLSE